MSVASACVPGCVAAAKRAVVGPATAPCLPLGAGFQRSHLGIAFCVVFSGSSSGAGRAMSDILCPLRSPPLLPLLLV